MVAHVPIPPRNARDIVHDAQIAPPHDVLADFAEAGVVKAYARLTETIHPDGRREEVRDRRIPRELWRRIIAEGKVADVARGTVRLGGSPEFGGGPKVTLIGIRFDDESVRSMAASHGDASNSKPGTDTDPEIAPPSPPLPPQPSGGSAAAAAPSEPPSEPKVECVDHGPLFQQPVSAVKPEVRPAISPDAKAVSIEEALRVLPIGRTKLYELGRVDKG